MHRVRIGAAIAVLAGSTLVVSAADPSFNGTWKLNLAKSQMTGQTLTISKAAAAGQMHFDMQGFSYDFDLTGKDFPTPDGGTTAWKQVNPTTWDATNKANGKVVSTVHIVVSDNKMNVAMKMTPPGGAPVEQTIALTRTAGGPGLLGTWKSTDMKGSPMTMVIAMDASNGIKITYPEFQMSCAAKLDGKDYSFTGAAALSKQMVAFEKVNPTTIKMTTKIDGKPFVVDMLVVSADGKTMTDSGKPVNANEPYKAVYDKQ